MSQIKHYFTGANNNLHLACEWLEELMIKYEESDLPRQVVQARVTALKGKIGVINSIMNNAAAYPWTEDEL